MIDLEEGTATQANTLRFFFFVSRQIRGHALAVGVALLGSLLGYGSTGNVHRPLHLGLPTDLFPQQKLGLLQLTVLWLFFTTVYVMSQNASPSGIGQGKQIPDVFQNGYLNLMRTVSAAFACGYLASTLLRCAAKFFSS